MPTVPRATRDVSVAPLPRARKSAAATALSEGAGLAQARAEQAEALGRVGGVVARIGTEHYARLQQEGRDLADEAAQLEAFNAIADFKRTRVYDRTSGAFSVVGKDAAQLREGVRTEYEALTGKLAVGMKTDRQRLRFEQLRAREWNSLDLDIERHTHAQIEAYDQGEYQAGLKNRAEAAVRSYLDPRRVAAELDEGIALIRTRAARTGAGPEAADVEIATFRSGVHTTVISNLLASGRDRAAQVYLEGVREAGQLSGEALAQMTKAVQAGVTEAEGERAAEAIWLRLGPKTDLDAISLDAMEAAAREQFGDDVTTMKATIAALRRRKTGVDDGRRERTNARDRTVWGAVFAGQSRDDLRRMPEVVADPELGLKVDQYFDREADEARREREHAETVAAARETRAAARESRALAVEERRERKLELDGWAEYYNISRPEALRALDEGQILGKLPTLGRAHVGRLLAAKERLTKDDETVRSATIESDLFKEVAESAGLEAVYKPPSQVSKAERALLGSLHAKVVDAIAAKQQAAGRQLTRDEKRDVMQELVDQRVMIDDGYFRDSEAFAALVNADDAAKAYVPLAQVPERNVRQAVNYLRSITSAYQAPGFSDERIRALNVRLIERAYAAHLLGLGADEELRRLRPQR